MTICIFPQCLELTNVKYDDEGVPASGWVINGAWKWTPRELKPEFWCSGTGGNWEDSLRTCADAYKAWIGNSVLREPLTESGACDA